MDLQNVVVTLAVRYGLQVLGAIVVLVVGLIAGRWLGGVVDQRLQGRAMEPPMRVLLVRVLRIVVMLFAVLVALDQVGFQVAPLVAGLGVAGIGLGFALQGVLSNMVAGLTIIFTKPFRVGSTSRSSACAATWRPSSCRRPRWYTPTARAWSSRTARSWARSSTTSAPRVSSTCCSRCRTGPT